MSTAWAQNPMASFPTTELVDEEQRLMANVSPMPGGEVVVSVSVVVTADEYQARALAERLMSIARDLRAQVVGPR